MGNAKKCILFVDDDPAVLAALASVLRRERDRWELVFVLGPHAALAELGRRSFDVVVSDQNMPEVGGDALLAEVKRTSPRTTCVMLSGDEPTGTAADARLAKPVSAKVLRATLEQLLEHPAPAAPAVAPP